LRTCVPATNADHARSPRFAAADQVRVLADVRLRTIVVAVTTAASTARRSEWTRHGGLADATGKRARPQPS